MILVNLYSPPTCRKDDPDRWDRMVYARWQRDKRANDPAWAEKDRTYKRERYERENTLDDKAGMAAATALIGSAITAVELFAFWIPWRAVRRNKLRKSSMPRATSRYLDRLSKRRKTDSVYRARVNAEARDYWRDGVGRREKALARARERYYQDKYGITIEQRDGILAAQGNCCACCGTATPGNKYGWQLDHDHATGVVRGLLCHTCNLVIGFLGDDLVIIKECYKQIVTYLRRSQCSTTP